MPSESGIAAKFVSALCVVLSLHAVGAAQSTGGAIAPGICSVANTGRKNIFNINCGIGREQGRKLLKIVNKIVANQLDSDAVMVKLDEIIANQKEEAEGRLRKEREDSFDRLTIKPLDLPSSREPIPGIDISIVNFGHLAINEHLVTCTLYGLSNRGDSSVIINSSAESPQRFRKGVIPGGGRGETVRCISMVRVDGPIMCADVSITMDFTIDGQPNEPLRKEIRYSYGPRGNRMEWVLQASGAREDFCKEPDQD